MGREENCPLRSYWTGYNIFVFLKHESPRIGQERLAGSDRIEFFFRNAKIWINDGYVGNDGFIRPFNIKQHYHDQERGFLVC